MSKTIVIKEKERRASTTVRRRKAEITVQEREQELREYKNYKLTEEEAQNLPTPKWKED